MSGGTIELDGKVLDIETARTVLKLDRDADVAQILRRFVAPDSQGVDQKKPKQADLLVELAQAAKTFHAPDNRAFATITVGGHDEVWPVRSKGFRSWLTRAFYQRHATVANNDAIQSAVALVEAHAQIDGPERCIYTRVAVVDDAMYLDLCDDRWRVVNITAEGWSVVDHAPVPFVKPAGMCPLPEPVRGGSVDMLRDLVNVRNDADFILLVAWILAALRAAGPYPVLALAGEQGAAKSSAAYSLRSLVDPNAAAIRSPPRNERDLFIAASNAHVLAFDNISKLPDWLSDAFCRLATGGGFATRSLYTDDAERIFDAQRPIILNGIEDFVGRPDLADRSIVLRLSPIPDIRRMAEQDFRTKIDAARPAILGALLDVVAAGIRNLPEVRLETLPRMADFAKWAAACEPALWDRGAFAEAYGRNRADATETIVDLDPVASAVRAHMQTLQMALTANCEQILGALTDAVGERRAKAKDWPKSASALSNRLRRAAPELRKVGIQITMDLPPACRGGPKLVCIERLPESSGKSPSTASAASVEPLFADGVDGDLLTQSENCQRCDGEGCNWCQT